MKEQIKLTGKKMQRLSRRCWNQVRHCVTGTAIKIRDRFRDACAAVPRRDPIHLLFRNLDEQAVVKELEHGGPLFGYLLEPSRRYLEGRPTDFYPSVESLHDGWLYVLEHPDTLTLLRVYKTLKRLSRSGHRMMEKWIRFLKWGGFRPMDPDTDQVTVSASVRLHYANTLGLNDGDVLNIDLHPWSFQGTTIAFGILDRRSSTTTNEEET